MAFSVIHWLVKEWLMLLILKLVGRFREQIAQSHPAASVHLTFLNNGLFLIRCTLVQAVFKRFYSFQPNFLHLLLQLIT
jgi:hypothetical protein